MAYSRIKVWIAAEVLTAANLNTEFTGCISNENDLGTKLTTEVTNRQTLEGEHDALRVEYDVLEGEYDTLAANVWDTNHINTDKVTTVSIVNGAVTGAKVASAIKDPIAATAGLRTLGTGAQQAKPGNWAPGDDELGLSQLESGTVMLPFCDSTTGTEHSEAGTAWVEKIAFKIFLPVKTTAIRMASRQKRGGGTVAYAKFKVGTISSTDNTTTSVTYEWKLVAYANVSALSGWQDLVVYLKGAAATTSYLQGYSFKWE